MKNNFLGLFNQFYKELQIQKAQQELMTYINSLVEEIQQEEEIEIPEGYALIPIDYPYNSECGRQFESEYMIAEELYDLIIERFAIV